MDLGVTVNSYHLSQCRAVLTMYIVRTVLALSVPSAPFPDTADHVHSLADPSRLFPATEVASTVFLAHAAKHNRLATSIAPSVPFAKSFDNGGPIQHSPDALSLSSAAAAAPSSSNPTPVLLTHVTKNMRKIKMAEVSSFSPIALPSRSSTAAGKKHRATIIPSSTDEISDSSDDDADKMDTEMPFGVQTALLSRNTQVNPPIVTGDV
jgi:hypothetical protein